MKEAWMRSNFMRGYLVCHPSARIAAGTLRCQRLTTV
jgi:hypothetical protein